MSKGSRKKSANAIAASSGSRSARTTCPRSWIRSSPRTAPNTPAAAATAHAAQSPNRSLPSRSRFAGTESSSSAFCANGFTARFSGEKIGPHAFHG